MYHHDPYARWLKKAYRTEHFREKLLNYLHISCETNSFSKEKYAQLHQECTSRKYHVETCLLQYHFRNILNE